MNGVPHLVLEEQMAALPLPSLPWPVRLGHLAPQVLGRPGRAWGLQAVGSRGKLRLSWRPGVEQLKGSYPPLVYPLLQLAPSRIPNALPFSAPSSPPLSAIGQGCTPCTTSQWRHPCSPFPARERRPLQGQAAARERWGFAMSLKMPHARSLHVHGSRGHCCSLPSGPTARVP